MMAPAMKASRVDEHAPSPASVAPLVRWVRHERVLLDFDVAAMYGVETRVLKQAVRRNRDRFPPDFMFELTTTEATDLVSQSVIPGLGKLGGSLPFAVVFAAIKRLVADDKAQKSRSIGFLPGAPRR
jgi:hypothetical protein